MKSKIFAKGVERLVNPVEVGNIHFFQSFNRLFPRSIQERMMRSSSKKYPYMGFVVEPYSFFTFHEILDTKKAQDIIPERFKLMKTKVFEDDEPKYYMIFGCFTAHTSGFWGTRIEFYTIAEDTKTGLLSWIIVDYDSNTISHDFKNGLRKPTCSDGIVTTDHRGDVMVDLRRDDKTRELIIESNVNDGVMTKLDQRLWLEGNLSIAYGKELADPKANPFSLKFEPCEVHQALKIPVDKVDIEANTWYPGLFREAPSVAACFPYAQHFISDSPGIYNPIMNKEELVKANEEIDFDKVEVFSVKQIKTLFALGMVMSFVVTVVLVLVLIFG